MPQNGEKLINENVVILDTRNQYESDIGSFNNSILPEIKSFLSFQVG